MRWFLNRPWLLVVLAFIILISAWITLFIIAGKNLPEPVEIQSSILTGRGQAVVCIRNKSYTNNGLTP
jgi:hypothetical protein